MRTKFESETLKGKKYLGNLGRIILKRISRK